MLLFKVIKNHNTTKINIMVTEIGTENRSPYREQIGRTLTHTFRINARLDYFH